MANSKEEKKEPKPAIQHKTDKHQNNFLWIGLALIIGIVAIGIALYTMQLNQQLQTKLSEANTKLSSQLDKLQQSQNNAQEQLDSKAQVLQNSETDMQAKVDAVNKQVHAALSQGMYGNQDWLLLKARYYLELAQINTYWTNDMKTSIAQLQEADRILAAINQPKIFDIRQIIAKEIAQLKALPAVDVTGLLSQLNAAQMSVSALNLQTPPESVVPSSADNQPAPSPNTIEWRSHLQNSVNLLEKLVVIRRDKEDIKPLLSPLFEAALKESIRLNLQEAQWAVLNNNSAVFDLALKQATQNLKRIVNSQDQATEALIKQLNELQQIKLIQEKPEIGLALPELNRLVENKDLPTPAGKGDK